MNLRIKKPAHKLRIIIVGCGKVGYTLVERLTKEGHDIVLIDQDAQVVAETSNQFDIMCVVGNGASYQVQQEAGIDEADLIIAVTKSDELNLLCCIIAAQIGRCAAIARVRTPDYSQELGYLRDKLGLAVIINPEMEAARQIAQLLYLPSALEINTFAHGQTQMVKFKIPEGNLLDDITIAYLGMNITNDILICAVERDGEIYIPDGSFRLAAGDVISFIAGYQTSRSFLNRIGFSTRQVKNTLIIGGGKAAYYLSMKLIAAGIKVKIIEKDFARCEELSTLLPEATIICGDGSDQDLLAEEGLDTVDSFVALTGLDEENIMLTLYAKHVSQAKVVTKINRITFTNIINQLDLGSVIYPRYITTEAIIAYVRARTASMDSNVESLYHMFDNRVEVIEFKVSEQCEFLNVPFKDLLTKDQLLVACIIRDGRPIIPTGMDSIHAGDEVIVVTTHTGFNDIEDILK